MSFQKVPDFTLKIIAISTLEITQKHKSTNMMTFTDLREELQVLADGERREENVVLRTETERLTHAVHAASDVVAVNKCVAAARLQETWLVIGNKKGQGHTPEVEFNVQTVTIYSHALTDLSASSWSSFCRRRYDLATP